MFLIPAGLWLVVSVAGDGAVGIRRQGMVGYLPKVHGFVMVCQPFLTLHILCAGCRAVRMVPLLRKWWYIYDRPDIKEILKSIQIRIPSNAEGKRQRKLVSHCINGLQLSIWNMTFIWSWSMPVFKIIWLTAANTGKNLIFKMTEEMNRCNHTKEWKQQLLVRELQVPNSLVMSSVWSQQLLDMTKYV